jgi:membrane protease subunit (stomatin/prohibitin family)
MGLWDRIAGEFVDVIAWLDDSSDTMVWRFERRDSAIKYGAKLTVREGQSAVFVNEGQVADVFGPGMYELFTANLPILSTLQAWPHGFESPFKADVYFFSTRRFTDLKWGTKNPVMLRDPEFGPVRLRSFGTYSIRVKDPALFLKEIVGTDGHFTTGEVTEQVRNMIAARFAGAVGTSGIPVLDLAASYEKLGDFITAKIGPEVGGYGLELLQLLVENVSLPPEVEQALDRRTSMGVIGDLGRYAQFQAAEAMRDAARNPGAAGASLGVIVGAGLGQQVGPWGAAQPSPAPRPAATAAPSSGPPPLPGQRRYHVAADGKPTGPFGSDELTEQARGGRLTPTTLVWAEGMAQWRPAGEVEELGPLLAAVPPPIPPVDG